jgi:hypothetical protein
MVSARPTASRSMRRMRRLSNRPMPIPPSTRVPTSSTSSGKEICVVFMVVSSAETLQITCRQP